MRLAAAGLLAEAAGQFEAALRLHPGNPVWYYNAALAWHHLNRLPDALGAYRRALELAPDFFDAWNNYSAALKTVGDIPGAVAAAQTAVRLRPDSAGPHLNLGNAIKAEGDLDRAAAAYRRALELNPADPRTQLNLANTLRDAGRLTEALAMLRLTVARHPQMPEAHRDLAFALLLSGDLLSGWVENEWRWQTEEMAPKRRLFQQPRWNGEELAGRTLFVYTEQGFGDAFQFVRYLGLAAARGGSVVLECQPALTGILASAPGVSQIVERGRPLPPFDAQIPLLSLPLALGTTLATIPNATPYLRPPAAAALPLPRVIGSRLGVGLVWAGNPGHKNDRQRSLPAPELKPLLEVPGVVFYSLQTGERAADWSRFAPSERLIDLSPRLTDFTATAAAIAQLELVICVDTAVAHLAGALGKPVWLLLPYAPDWRWLLGRKDSPWYPTMRLIRQTKPCDWTSVMQTARSLLTELVA